MENEEKNVSICSLTLKALQEWLVSHGEKGFRAAQIFHWLYQEQVASFAEMTNLSKELREKLEVALQFSVLRCCKVEAESDGETEKFLWELQDGKLVESVLIYSGDRRTVCVSSQVGCPARCAFCASGKEGLVRNLNTAEIVEQVLSIDRILKKRGERVSHVVFMGMGEPMENYGAVVQALHILCAAEAFHISQRRITVSTVGVVEGINRLAQEDVKVNLALSLHAPDQHVRRKIIPYARRYSLEEVLSAVEGYAQKTKRDITYEYTLLAGVNDSIDCAEKLAVLLRGRQCSVNLIPYNPVPGVRLNRPHVERITTFQDVLERRGISVTRRYTKGNTIAASCGQLALRTRENIQCGTSG